MKLNCVHADTCLPDYWSGHHRPHIAVPVHRDMTIRELRNALRDELRQGAVMGSGDDAYLLSSDLIPVEKVKQADALTRAAYAAIRRDVRMAKAGARHPFRDLEPSDDGGDSVYAYFVFMGA